jgi:uncharacterized membrane protein (DUF4010 family)
MALLLFVVSPATLTALTPALAAGGLTAAIYGLAFTLFSFGSDNPGQTERGRAFNLQAGLVLAATMAVMLLIAADLKDRLGEAGVIVGAALAGLIDTHAAAMSIASLTAAEKLTPHDAVLPILAAMSCNALAKGVMAASAGSLGFALRILPGLILSMAAAWSAALATILK